MFDKTYRNKAGKSFTEGKKFRMSEFLDYYNSLTDDEWDAAIQMAADKGYDISNIKPYMRVFGSCLFRPMSFEEVCSKLLDLHGPHGLTSDMGVVEPVEDQREMVEWLYAQLEVPIPDYWRDKLWS